MITTKADKLLRSLIDAGLSLTEFTILATKIMRIQRDFKIDNEDRRQRDRLRQQDKLREQYNFEQQIKEEEQRRIQGLKKLRELGYVPSDETSQISNNNKRDNLEQYSVNQIKTDQLLVPYTKEINNMKQKQRDCCLTFNIDYDLRLNQQTLEKACRRAKRNVYELRAERFNRPEYRSVLSVETVTLHNKLKEAIREINKIFGDSKSNQDKRYLQELLTYISQFEGDIDLLMCQMQYEPKVKETILFSPVTTDILDRMNLILHHVRTLANKISTKDYLDENFQEENPNDLSNIPTKVTYIIKIKTNDEINSSLSNETNVTIKLHGTYNKSPDIRLIQSINKIKWQSGQIDLFNIELNYLGDIYAIEIWHDGQYSSWKVDWIEIIDDAANIYRFPLDRLFDKYSNDKKTRFIIQSDIGPVNRLPTKPVKQLKPYKQIGFSTYTIQVKTGKQPNKVTDSSIFIQLKGENGEFSDNLCSANSAFKSSVFEPDQLDTFYLVWPYLAKLNSLHLLVQSEGIQPSWFCEYINVEDGQTGDKYKFIVNQLFDGSNPDDPNLKRHLVVYPENINKKDDNEEKEKPGYLMKIKTGEKGLSNMSTLPPINMILKGEKGKSEPYILKPIDNKKKLFEENQTDEFLIPSKYYIGPIKALQLSSNGQLDKWFIENIIIRDIAQGKDYVFPVYKWMNKQDGTNNLTVQPINERKADYKVYTRTIASELKGPDRSIKLVIQGNKGKNEIELNYPISLNNTFQPGHKDEYYIENMKSLGDLKSIELDVTHPNIKKLGLDYIEIKDLATNDSYRFNINRMLDSKNPKMTAKAELIPRSVINSASSKINPNQLTLPNTTSTMSNKKNFDQLTMNLPQGAKRRDNGSKISIKVDESSDQSDSIDKDNLNESDIENKSMTASEMTQENSYKTNKDKDELRTNSIEKSISKHDKSSIKDKYKIKIKTINKEFLDKDTKLQIELIDENGKSIFNQTENDLQKGKINTITLDTNKDFGKLKNIKLSLIGSKLKKKNLYQPEFIEISHPNSDKTYRLDYTKDDYLNSDKNRLELTKSIKLLSDTNIRENTQPQRAASSTIRESTQPQGTAFSTIRENTQPKGNVSSTIRESTQPQGTAFSTIRENTQPQGTASSTIRENTQPQGTAFSAIRENTQPQGTASSTIRENTPSQGTVSSTISKSIVPPYPKLANKILSENDEENLSLPNHTTTSSTSQNLSKEINSSSEKVPSRQIRPGDRVKSSSKRQLIIEQSKPSLHEADWYRRSMETNKDHRDETKQIQLISDKHFSQTKFDQKQANVIENKQDENQKLNRQLSNEKKINLLPKKSSSRSLKQEKPTKIISKLPSYNQHYENEFQTEMMNVKTRTKSNIPEKNPITTKEDKILSTQQLPINEILNSDQHLSYSMPVKEQKKINERSKQTTPLSSSSKQLSIDQRQISQTKQINNTDDPTSSNISEITKASTNTYEQSKTSTGPSKTSHLLSQNNRTPIESNSIITRSTIENKDKSITNKQQTETSTIPFKNEQKVIPSSTYNPLSNQSISVPPKSQTANDILKRRSQSVSSSRKPSNILSPISSSLPNSDQISQTSNPSATESHLSQLAPKTITSSIQSENFSNQLSKTSTSNKIPTDSSSVLIKQKNSQKPQLNITDSPFNEYKSQQNIPNISAVTIHTIATKSDSDLNSAQKSIDSHESEYSLQNKSLLSPDMSKKSRKNHRQNKQISISQPSITPSNSSTINKLDNPISATNNEYLSKETNDIQNAPRPVSYKSQSDHTPSAIELKTSNVQSITNSKQSSIESYSKDKDISSQSSLNTSITTDKSLISTTTTQNHSLSSEIFDNKYSVTYKKQSTNSNLPTKLTEIDHMSTVYEESEPSTISIPNVVSSSLSEHDSKQENLQDWSETSSNISSSQQNFPLNNQIKSSSKEKSLPKSPNPSNYNKKTVDTKILTPIQSNTSIDYEFRVQTGNESHLDGTNESVSIELINTKGQSIKVPLIKSINNSKPFQKGQLDIFHLNIPNNFHNIKKIILFLSQTIKDPLHIRYCELQDRKTMNTLYFPIEKWLGENNAYNVEMYINDSLF